jgi:hypothetical protein
MPRYALAAVMGLMAMAAAPAFAGPTMDLLADPDTLADHFVFACDGAADPQACLSAQFDAASRIQEMNDQLAAIAATDSGEAEIESCGTKAGVPAKVDLVKLVDCLSKIN